MFFFSISFISSRRLSPFGQVANFDSADKKNIRCDAIRTGSPCARKTKAAGRRSRAHQLGDVQADEMRKEEIGGALEEVQRQAGDRVLAVGRRRVGRRRRRRIRRNGLFAGDALDGDQVDLRLHSAQRRRRKSALEAHHVAWNQPEGRGLEARLGHQLHRRLALPEAARVRLHLWPKSIKIDSQVQY